jgi:hypothetical protein
VPTQVLGAVSETEFTVVPAKPAVPHANDVAPEQRSLAGGVGAAQEKLNCAFGRLKLRVSIVELLTNVLASKAQYLDLRVASVVELYVGYKSVHCS